MLDLSSSIGQFYIVSHTDGGARCCVPPSDLPLAEMVPAETDEFGVVQEFAIEAIPRACMMPAEEEYPSQE